MSSSDKVSLSDFVSLQRGFDLPMANRRDGTVPVVASRGIAGYHSEAKVTGPGVVIGRSGSIGGGQYIERDFWPLNTTLWVKDFKGNDRRFTYYLLKSIDFSRFNAGAGVPTLNRNHISSLKISSYGRQQQTRIASILSAYDDLIENNRRRIQLLEESARLLYKEWFVHLRFPGHEHVKIVDGVPKGWEPSVIGELSTVYRGKSYKSSELRNEGGRDFINLKCIKRYGGFRSSGLKRFEGEHKDHHRVNAGEIVMAVTDMTRDAMIVAQAGRVPISIGAGAIYSMDLVKIVPKPDIQPSWLYLLLRYSGFSFEVREHATGTNVLHLKPKYIEGWNTPLPSASLRRAFADIVDPILGQIDVLESQNLTLEHARDLLLPKLMNGEIEA